MDVVIPSNNEQELLEIAEKLGEKELVLLYNLKEYKDKNLDFKTNISISKGIKVESDKDIPKIPTECKYVFARNPTRMMVESKKINYYFELEDQKKADFIHHRNSGMNQVYAKLMQEKEKTYCFSYNLLLNSKRKGQLLGRFRQNVKLCKKYNLNKEVFSFATKPYELSAKHERKAIFSILN